MNGFYNGYNGVVIETPEEREEKRRNLKRLFSRVFLGLFLFVSVSQLLFSAIFVAAHYLLPQDQYAALAESSVATVLLNIGVQYLVAFPIFMITLIGTPKVQKREKEKLSVSEFFMIFLIGEALMYVGSVLGTYLNGIVGTFTGEVPEDSITAIVNETPTWLIFIAMVIAAPIFEELIFRRLMIDRLSIYGDHMAIFFSAIAFGLMHANLYQFFYATLIGALLGYVYTRTRRVGYTILLHMILNFMGSVAILPFEESIIKFFELYEAFLLGQTVDSAALIYSGAITAIFYSLQFGMIVAGIIVLVSYAKAKKFTVNRDKDIYLPDKEVIKNGFANVGAILFLAISFILTLMNMLV